MRHPLKPHQLLERVTPTEDTIVLCHFGIPRMASADWSLSIDGLVDRPLRLSLDDLKSKPLTRITSVHECCGSPLKPNEPTRRVCNVVWGGARLSDLLDDCGVRSNARFVWARGADYGVFGDVECNAFIKDLPLERVAADVLIAYEMNGVMLRPENGFPARLVVPGYYGTNSVKWLVSLTLAGQRADSPFMTRWYVNRVRENSGKITSETPVWSIAPESLIVSPAPDSTLTTGQDTEIWGWAWSDSPLAAVEVSADDLSEWTEAMLEPASGRSWRRFATTWRPGVRTLRSRATSIDGEQQLISDARNAIYGVSVNVT